MQSAPKSHNPLGGEIPPPFHRKLMFSNYVPQYKILTIGKILLVSSLTNVLRILYLSIRLLILLNLQWELAQPSFVHPSQEFNIDAQGRSMSTLFVLSPVASTCFLTYGDQNIRPYTVFHHQCFVKLHQTSLYRLTNMPLVFPLYLHASPLFHALASPDPFVLYHFIIWPEFSFIFPSKVNNLSFPHIPSFNIILFQFIININAG